MPSFYRAVLPADWALYEPPSYRKSATFDARVSTLRRSLDAHSSPLALGGHSKGALGGHSMGAALADAVALLEPDRVERRLLVGPAGLH